MADEDRWNPHVVGTVCTPHPRERLWTMTKNGKRIDAELLFQGEQGVEIQFLHEGVMAYARRWTLHAQAVEEATSKRMELEQQGWSLDLSLNRTGIVGERIK